LTGRDADRLSAGRANQGLQERREATLGEKQWLAKHTDAWAVSNL